MARHARRPCIVIIGGGFAGLAAARALRNAPARVVMIDQRNHHLFQPLLYQVATAALSPANIAAPIRKILRSQRNCEVVLGTVTSIDAENRRVLLDGESLDYDALIVATGATHSYFGNDQWAEHAPGLKTVEDALEIRRRFLLAFENAELEADEKAREAALTFVVVGGGPTGVELAGTISEIARKAIPPDFRAIDTATSRVILLEAVDRVLPHFAEQCSIDAKRHLQELGVEVRVSTPVTDIDERGVWLGDERLETCNVFWAAGVRASSLSQSLRDSAGAELDKAGKVKVADDLSLPAHPEIFVVGDLAHVERHDGEGMVPGLAPAAMQMGKHAGKILAAEAAARQSPQEAPRRKPFRYIDKGSLATIGRSKAVGDIRGRYFHGFVAWALWLLVHIFFLIGFRRRVIVVMEWAWLYVFYDRGARLITGTTDFPLRSPRAPTTNEPLVPEHAGEP